MAKNQDQTRRMKRHREPRASAPDGRIGESTSPSYGQRQVALEDEALLDEILERYVEAWKALARM